MKTLLFVILHTCFNVYSQQYTISYNVNVNDHSLLWGTRDAYKLITKTDGLYSVEHRKDLDTIIIQQSGLIYETKDQFFADSLKFQRIKNISKNVVEYEKYSGQVVVKDTISIDYKIGEKQKTILGYSCKNVFFEFRGRYYEGYYSKDIPIADGPFKFIGAPGLLLEVNSFDDSVKIKATAIALDLDNMEPLHFNKKKWFGKRNYIFSYKKYVQVYLNQWYDIVTKLESEYANSSSSFNSRGIEILPNKLDPEIDE